MAEAKKAAPAAVVAEPVPKKKNTVLYIVIALLLLVVIAIAGVGAFLYFSLMNPGGTDTAGVDAPPTKTQHSPKKTKSPEAKPVFAKLETYTVNLRGTSSVLQTEIYVQMADEHMKDTITAWLPRISSQVILLLSAKSAEELTTVEAKQKLMVDVKDTINKVLGAKDDEEGVMSAEFKTFIIQ